MALTEQDAKTRETVSKIVKDGFIEHLCYLKDRWNEEKEYENFADYKASMIKVFTTLAEKENLIVTKIQATKSPFGIAFNINGLRFQVSTTLKRWKIAILKRV